MSGTEDDQQRNKPKLQNEFSGGSSGRRRTGIGSADNAGLGGSGRNRIRREEFEPGEFDNIPRGPKFVEAVLNGIEVDSGTKLFIEQVSVPLEFELPKSSAELENSFKIFGRKGMNRNWLERESLYVIVWTARKFHNTKGIPFEELILEGLRIVKQSILSKFKANECEPDHFGYYLEWCLKNHFSTLKDRKERLKQDRRLQNLVTSVKNESRILTLVLNREPTLEEIASKMGIGLLDVIEVARSEMFSELDFIPVSEKSPTLEYGYVLKTLSCSPLVENTGQLSTWANRKINRFDLAKYIYYSYLPRESLILGYKWGFADGENHSLEETATKFATTDYFVKRLERNDAFLGMRV